MQNPDYENGLENMDSLFAEVEPQNEDGSSAQEGGVQDEAQSPEAEQKKPKRRGKKQDDEPPEELAGSEPPDSDDAQSADSFDGEEPGMDETEDIPQEDAVEVTPRGRRELGLDSRGRVIYDRGDTGQHDLSVLTGARNARRILTATIDGIDPGGEAKPRVVFQVGAIKVLIPYSEMGMVLPRRNRQ